VIDKCTGMEDENADEGKENSKLVTRVRFFRSRRMESIRWDECCTPGTYLYMLIGEAERAPE
jgi:hypothetical protein